MYESLQRHTQQLCQKVTYRGIHVNVTSRIKSKESLLKKIEGRVGKYRTVDEAKRDIIDVLGLRILVYFPSSLSRVYDHVQVEFDIDDNPNYPSQESILPINESSARKTVYQPEFPGYTAQHYRVQLKEEERRFVEGYSGETFEIQVVSALAHVWTEIQHDILYKWCLDRERPTEDVARLVDSLNGLTKTGEVILNQLERNFHHGIFNIQRFRNKYELGSYLCETVHQRLIKKGSLNVLFRFLNAVNTNSRTQIEDEIERLGISKKHQQMTLLGHQAKERFRPFDTTASVLIMQRMLLSFKRMALGGLWVMVKNKHDERVYQCRVVMSTLIWPVVLFPPCAEVACKILHLFEGKETRKSLNWALQSFIPFNIQQGIEADDGDYKRIEELWVVSESSNEAIFNLSFSIARLGIWRELADDLSLLERLRSDLIVLDPRFFDCV